MDHLSDENLLQKIAQQDSAALELLYDRHAQTVFNLIGRIVRDMAIADELLQETFWQVWQQADRYRGEGSAAAWMYRIARNKSLDQLRRQKARPQPLETGSEADDQAVWDQLPADNAEVEPVVEQRRDSNAVRQALQEIPSEQRQCLELAYFEGMSQRQIAEHTATPLGTVKTRIKMGMEKMERFLRAEGYRTEDFY
ncbi:MAG: sigma-70 family RNA polymerase sigma factor [Anaerolineae bacterium]|nr:sigma-70 family RNA polymerase sigma factor [Anaerolineae bacterium]